MGRITGVVAAVILCVALVGTLELWADDQTQDSKNIVVEIDYGVVRPSRTVKVPCVQGKTALEVLQSMATVETHPVGDYVFVAAIDGVAGKRGEMAWYYTVDGRSADKLAYANVLTNDVQCIRWVYKKDVCSEKVDGKSNPSE